MHTDIHSVFYKIMHPTSGTLLFPGRHICQGCFRGRYMNKTGAMSGSGKGVAVCHRPGSLSWVESGSSEGDMTFLICLMLLNHIST